MKVGDKEVKLIERVMTAEDRIHRRAIVGSGKFVLGKERCGWMTIEDLYLYLYMPSFSFGLLFLFINFGPAVPI